MERDVSLPLVREFMNPRVKVLDADTPIEDALRQLMSWGFSGAPVTRAGEVVGVLSELDCMRVLAGAAYHAIPEGTVGDHMTREVDVLTPTLDLFAVTSLFEQTRHRRFPVVDEGKLVGIVTLRDMDKALWDLTRVRHQRTVERHPGAAWVADR